MEGQVVRKEILRGKNRGEARRGEKCIGRGKQEGQARRIRKGKVWQVKEEKSLILQN